MAFMNLKTIAFQNKKNFLTSQICSFYFFCYLVSLITSQICHFLCQDKALKRIGVTKSNVFTEFVMTLMASPPVIHRKTKVI